MKNNRNNQEFIQAIEESVIVPAIKDEVSLNACLDFESNVVFILYGDIMNIADIVNKVKNSGKLAMVHMDLISGLASKDVSVDYLKNVAMADGIITTKPSLAKYAREIGLYTVLRFFMIDSLALSNLEKQSKDVLPDLIEILPGVMPKIINRIVCRTKTPLVVGGLISDKEDVVSALDAGAIAVTSTNSDIWRL